MVNNLLPRNRLLTADEIEIRVWAFVVLMVTVILAGIVFFMLYSVTFVTQPIKSMAPIDQAYTKMLNDIILLIVGGIGGVMSKKGVSSLSEKLASNQTPPTPPAAPSATPAPATPTPPAPPAPASSGMPDFNWMGFKNPELDETWRPGPPPTTAPDHLDPSREEIAAERASAKAEA